jgi:hypothetical protein
MGKLLHFLWAVWQQGKHAFYSSELKKCLQLKVVSKRWFTWCCCVWLLDVLQDEEWEFMYWIYLLPSAQQTVGYNGFITTCFDSHELSSGYIQNLSVLAVLLLTVSCSGCCWSVWSGGWPYSDMNENLNTYIKKCC